MYDKIYEMKLHDIISIEEKDITIMRVPGGWIYESWTSCGADGYFMTSTFVPYCPKETS